MGQLFWIYRLSFIRLKQRHTGKFLFATERKLPMLLKSGGSQLVNGNRCGSECRKYANESVCVFFGTSSKLKKHEPSNCQLTHCLIVKWEERSEFVICPSERALLWRVSRSLQRPIEWATNLIHSPIDCTAVSGQLFATHSAPFTVQHSHCYLQSSTECLGTSIGHTKWPQSGLAPRKAHSFVCGVCWPDLMANMVARMANRNEKRMHYL